MKGQHRLRKAETPWLTTYGAQRHAWPNASPDKSTAKRVPQLTKVAGGNALWITPDFSPVLAQQRKKAFRRYAS